MAAPTILVTAGIFSDCEPVAGEALRAAGYELRPAQPPGPLSESALIEQLQGCVAVIASTDPYTEAVFAARPELKIVARWGIGYDSVDVAAATRHGVMVVNTPGLVTEAVADMTLALMLGVARSLPACDRAVRAGEWPAVFSGQLFDKTLGLVGLGQIGQAVARRAAGFSMTLLAHDPYADADRTAALGVRLIGLEELLRASDFVSLHCTMGPATQHLIGRAQLQAMKPTAYLINAGRGKLVDQAALVEALREGWIAGAGLDVLAEEPPDPQDPLLQLENVVLTPHCSSFTHDTVARVNQRVCENILQALGGVQPDALLNPEVWEGRE
jgi:phosphoglycerate dehydrogenase-like enzyme